MLKRTVKSLSTILVIILSVALFCSFSAGCVEPDKKVILISIDGLRADVIENTEYGRYLMQNHAYTLEVTTVNPSITLPCHTSMFYSVTPSEHGIIANTYTPEAIFLVSCSDCSESKRSLLLQIAITGMPSAARPAT